MRWESKPSIWNTDEEILPSAQMEYYRLCVQSPMEVMSQVWEFLMRMSKKSKRSWTKTLLYKQEFWSMKCMFAEVFLETAYQRNNRLPSQIFRNKLRNSKIIARNLRAIYPNYRVHLKHLKLLTFCLRKRPLAHTRTGTPDTAHS